MGGCLSTEGDERKEKQRMRRISIRTQLDIPHTYESRDDPRSPQDMKSIMQQRKRSVKLPEGMASDGVIHSEEDLALHLGYTPKKSTAQGGFSKLPLTYEATVEAGFDCDRGGSPIVKECQDKAFVDECYLDQDNQAILCVFDGHGPHGKKCARDTCKFFIDSLGKHKLGTKRQVRYAFNVTCDKCEKYLEMSPYDTRVSGTTMTACILMKDKLHIGWVGDSRAVIATRGPNRELVANDLTKDHKPEDPVERKRIQRMGGEVKKFILGNADDDDGIPYRVFVAGTMVPGLAMSRSIGDTMATDVGATPKPDIVTRDLHPSDTFIIIASDGLWEVFDGQEACEWVEEYVQENRESDGSLPGHGDDPLNVSVCVGLANEAQRRWVVNFEAKCIVDDTSVIVAYLFDDIMKDQIRQEKTKRHSALFSDHRTVRKRVSHFLPKSSEEPERGVC